MLSGVGFHSGHDHVEVISFSFLIELFLNDEHVFFVHKTTGNDFMNKLRMALIQSFPLVMEDITFMHLCMLKDPCIIPGVNHPGLCCMILSMFC